MKSPTPICGRCNSLRSWFYEWGAIENPLTFVTLIHRRKVLPIEPVDPESLLWT